MKIYSTAFAEGEMIPKRFTCDGENVSPPLFLEAIPEDAESLVLICDDPDAPVGHWDHWLLFNIPADQKKIPEAIPPEKILKNGAVHGRNSWGKLGYGGPCPPSGVHRYYFRLLALNRVLTLAVGAPRDQLEKSIEDAVIDSCETMGRYSRQA